MPQINSVRQIWDPIYHMMLELVECNGHYFVLRKFGDGVVQAMISDADGNIGSMITGHNTDCEKVAHCKIHEVIKLSEINKDLKGDIAKILMKRMKG